MDRHYGVGFSTHRVNFSDNNRKEGYQKFCFCIRLQVEGSAHVKINNNVYNVHPGAVSFWQPDDHYSLDININYNNKVSSDFHLICYSPWIADWWQANTPPNYLFVGLDNQIISLWRQIVHEKQRVMDADDAILEYLTRALCMMLGRALGSSRAKKANTYLPYRMKAYIEEHATSKITLKDVANYAGLGVTRASQLFKETFNQSIMDYAITVKLSIATERLMYSSTSLEQIAQLSGYDSYSHFYRTFRKRMGISPKAFRQNNNLQLRLPGPD